MPKINYKSENPIDSRPLPPQWFLLKTCLTQSKTTTTERYNFTSKQVAIHSFYDIQEFYDNLILTNSDGQFRRASIELIQCDREGNKHQILDFKVESISKRFISYPFQEEEEN